MGYGTGVLTKAAKLYGYGEMTIEDSDRLVFGPKIYKGKKSHQDLEKTSMAFEKKKTACIKKLRKLIYLEN